MCIHPTSAGHGLFRVATVDRLRPLQGGNRLGLLVFIAVQSSLRLGVSSRLLTVGALT